MLISRTQNFTKSLPCHYFYAICSCCFLVIRASFEHDQSECFVDNVVLYLSMSLFSIMEHPSLSQSSSTFAIKCSWQIVNIFSDFAELVVVDPCMLCCCSCHVQLLCHVYLLVVCLVCHEMPRSECNWLINMPTRYLFCHAPVFHSLNLFMFLLCTHACNSIF